MKGSSTLLVVLFVILMLHFPEMGICQKRSAFISYVMSDKIPISQLCIYTIADNPHRVEGKIILSRPMFGTELKLDTITFYSKDDPALYDSIRSGKRIRNAFIELLDLNKLASVDTSRRLATVDAPLNFVRCIIAGVRSLDPGTEEMDSLEFSPAGRRGVGRFDSVAFNGLVSFRNCYVAKCAFTRSIFRSSVELVNIWSTFDVLNFEMLFDQSTFKDRVYFINSSVPRRHLKIVGQYYNITDLSTITKVLRLPFHISFENSTFNKEVNICNENDFKYFDFSVCVFQKNVDISQFKPKENFFRRLSDAEDSIRKSHRPRSIYSIRNLNFQSATFQDAVSFENCKISRCNFDQSRFFGPVISVNAKIDTARVTTEIGIAFANSFFQRDNAIISNKLGPSFADFRFNYPSLQQIRFPYPRLGDSKLDENEYNNALDYYLSLIPQVQEQLKTNNDLRDHVVNTINHEKKLTELEYYWENPFNPISNVLKFLWYGFLEVVVGNGYEGEDQFFLTSLAVIIIFAGIYFIGFRKEVSSFLQSLDDKTKGIHTTHRPKMDSITLIKCIWVSFYIFISPKFLLSFFALRRSLFMLFLVEWILGISLMVLFLAFIAVNYSFIKAIIGL